MFRFLVALTLILGLSPGAAQAAPSVASVQQEVNRLRTLAAEKFEDANEATIRIKALERETGALESREAVLRKELDAASATLSRIAISQYTAGGFGQGFDLLFSSDPTKYLSDAGVMDLLARNYSTQLREYATTKQKVEASQLVVADRTSQLRAEREKLNKQVANAKADLAKAEKLLKGLKKEDRERLAREEADRENKIGARKKRKRATRSGRPAIPFRHDLPGKTYSPCPRSCGYKRDATDRARSCREDASLARRCCDQRANVRLR